MDDEIRYKIALTMIKGIGPAILNKIVEGIGTIETLFEISDNDLRSLALHLHLKNNILNRKEALAKADKEIEFCERNDIRIITNTSKEYPYRLKQCPDSPLVIYCKGDINLNEKKFVSMVGTRRITSYGKQMCDKIVNGFKELEDEIVIVSGLAYGVDVASHKAALANNIRTIGVVAHGLNQLYPAAHKNIARQMVESGGAILSDFTTHNFAEPHNFLKRNRIIAGLSDVIIVVESAHKGGSMITAALANDYSRELCAIPGRIGDKYSEGCNLLIKNQRANLVENANDIKEIMGWIREKEAYEQLSIPEIELNEKEKLVYDSICEKEKISINELNIKTGIAISKISSILLILEIKKLIISLPGNMYTKEI